MESTILQYCRRPWYYCSFEPVLNSYHVTFKNPDGEILKEEDVLYGHSSTPPENPKMDQQ